jgi:uncharacterized cupredoxin-like copper-binding protein
MLSKRTVLFFVLLTAMILTACGTQGGQAPQGASGPVEVRVAMTEFAFESPITEFQTGVTYRFVVTNNGAIPHEFMIIQPMENASDMTMEELDEMALVVVEEDDLSSGATQTVEFTFTETAPAGSLEFACHTPGHYDAGMKLPITVK